MNIEADVIAHLADALDVPVYAQPVEPRPDSFVTVERSGGTAGFVTEKPVLTVQWWAASIEEASELQRAGHAALWEMVDSDDYPTVCAVSIESTPRYVDPESGQARYETRAEFTIQII